MECRVRSRAAGLMTAHGKYKSEELRKRLRAFRRRYIERGSLTVGDLAKVLRVSRQSVYNLTETGTTYSRSRAEDYLLALVRLEEGLSQGLEYRDGKLYRKGETEPTGDVGRPGSDIEAV